MTFRNKVLSAVAVMSLALGVNSAFADNTTTVTTTTYESNRATENARIVDLSVYDVNGDGKYSMVEVGERLFKDFDTDGNEVIDNIEWDNEIYRTITPMERETFTYVDYGSDGWVEESAYTYETFYEESGLMQFDENGSGLSAEDFIEKPFQSIDDNDSGTIDLEEWQEAYMGSRAKHEEPENYNR